MGMSKTYKRRMAATEAFNRVADGKGRGAGAPGAKSPKEKADERAERDAKAKAHNGAAVRDTGMNTFSPTVDNFHLRNRPAALQRFQSRARSVAFNRGIEDEYMREGSVETALHGRPSTWAPTQRTPLDQWPDDDHFMSRAQSVAVNREQAKRERGTPTSANERSFNAARTAKKRLRPRGFKVD